MAAAFFAGLMVHMFGLVNILHNYDSIAVMPDGYGTGVTSGRWLLTVLGNMVQKQFGGYSTAWFDGVLGILILSVSVYFLIKIFDIKSRMFSILLGIGFVSFPAVGSCMLFRYTLCYYALAVLMAVLAAYLVIRGNKKLIILWIALSGFLSACALGIYQAYFPITASIFVLYLIQQTVQNRKNWKKILIQGLIFLLCLALGILLYFLILKLSLVYYGASLSNYQGIDTMGKLSIAEIPKLLLSSFTTFFTMPINNSFVLAPIQLLTIIYLLWDVASAAMMIWSLIKRKASPMQWILAVLLCIVFPVVLVLFMPVVLFEALPAPAEKYGIINRIIAGVLAVSLGLAGISYAYVTNVTYTAQYYADRHVENLANSILTQVRSTENYRPELPWAFIGNYYDPLLSNYTNSGPILQGEGDAQRLVGTYSWPFWFRVYVGFYIVLLDEDAKADLTEKTEVQDMPCWPSNGSVRIIDDTVVVKFSDVNK